MHVEIKACYVPKIIIIILNNIERQDLEGIVSLHHVQLLHVSHCLLGT